MVLISCKKKPNDYRDKYVGDYSFKYHYTFTPMGGSTYESNADYEGKILKRNSTSYVNTTWYDGTSSAFSISESGTISKCGKKIGTITETYFEFSYDDNVCGAGMNGAVEITELKGTRIIKI